jgi:hypothetical protein
MGKIKLIDHRNMLNANRETYIHDLKNDRLANTLITHIRKDYSGIRFATKKKQIIKKIVNLLFEAQEQRPFFHIEGTELPLCWNRPKDWDCDYIKYEWGHLFSKNQNPDKKNIIENLGLYSARCNQHIQSSMNIQELMIYGGILAQRISNVLTNRRKLFETQNWKGLINELEECT